VVPEREYVPLVKGLGSEIIRFATGSNMWWQTLYFW